MTQGFIGRKQCLVPLVQGKMILLFRSFDFVAYVAYPESVFPNSKCFIR